MLANAATTFSRTANMLFDPGIIALFLLPQCEGIDVSNSLEVGISSADTLDCRRVVGETMLNDMDRDLQQCIREISNFVDQIDGGSSQLVLKT